MSAIRIDDSEIELITIDEAKNQCNIDEDFDDELINRLIKASRHFCESYCEIAIGEQTWQLSVDSYGDFIELKRPRFISIDSINYIDIDGKTQELSDYYVDDKSYYTKIYPKLGDKFPNTYPITNAITINYKTGFTEINEDIKHAMLILISHWYENRESQVIGLSVASLEFSIDALLSQHRMPIT